MLIDVTVTDLHDRHYAYSVKECSESSWPTQNAGCPGLVPNIGTTSWVVPH